MDANDSSRNAIKRNVAKLVGLDNTARGKSSSGVYRLTSDPRWYNPLFLQHGSLEAQVEEVISENGQCDILEVGVGDGVCAKYSAKKFGKSVSYTGLGLTKPKYARSMEWVGQDMDSFVPEKKFDVIFGFNALQYAYDEWGVFFKLANSLNKGGLITFNTRGIHPGGVEFEKKSKIWKERVSPYMLDAMALGGLQAGAIHMGGADMLGDKVVMGVKISEKDVLQEDVREKADELKGQRVLGYTEEYSSELKWVRQDELEGAVRVELESLVLKKFEALEESNGLSPQNKKEEEARGSFVKDQLRYEMVAGELLEEKQPVEVIAKGLVEIHPVKRLRDR